MQCSRAQELVLLAMTAIAIKDALPFLMPKLHTLIGLLLLQEPFSFQLLVDRDLLDISFEENHTHHLYGNIGLLFT